MKFSYDWLLCCSKMNANVPAVDALAVPPPEYSGGGWRDFCLTQ